MHESAQPLRNPVVQRKCGCGGSCGPCAEEKKKKVQRRATGETANRVPQSVSSILGSAGRALDEETRGSMESRFGRSFADVRVHTDTHAAESAKEINAAAYTSGTDIVFGAGRFAPQTPDGRHLLAHELAHVVQQRSGTALEDGIGPADDVYERTANQMADTVVALGPAFAPPRLIVDDSETAAPGQMRRAEFAQELDAAICATSREEMGRLGRSTEGCPLLEEWRPKIRGMGAKQIEVSMRRWIGGDVVVRSARDYIPHVQQRLASSLRIWGKTGQVVGVPSDLLALFSGGKMRIGVGSLITGAIGGLFRKSRGGAAAPSHAAMTLREGRPIDGGVATRMGAAFGRDFSGVRIHTDAEAAASASRLNARAVTVGSDIAFAGGEYAPGTLVGDALLAHELAHVAQQDGAEGPLAKSNDEAGGALEHDADDAAVHAVTSLWPNMRRFAANLRANAMPRLKSTLQLQACTKVPEIAPKAKDADKFLEYAKNTKMEGCTPEMQKEIAALYPEAVARVDMAVAVLATKERGPKENIKKVKGREEQPTDKFDIDDFDRQLQRHFKGDSTTAGLVDVVLANFRQIQSALKNPQGITFRCREGMTACEGATGQGGCHNHNREVILCGAVDPALKVSTQPRFLRPRSAESSVTGETHDEWVRTLIHEHAHTVCNDNGGPKMLQGEGEKGESYFLRDQKKGYPTAEPTRNPDSYAWFAMEVSKVKR